MIVGGGKIGEGGGKSFKSGVLYKGFEKGGLNTKG